MTPVAWQPADGVLNILVVGLASTVRTSLTDVLSANGRFTVDTCATPAAAAAALAARPVDCVVLDAAAPDGLTTLRAANPDVPVVTLGEPTASHSAPATGTPHGTAPTGHPALASAGAPHRAVAPRDAARPSAGPS